MKVAVTGASGYLGGHVTAALLRRGHEVVALTRRPLKTADIAHLPFELGGTVPTAADFASQGVQAVVHCAWDFMPRGLAAARRVNVAGAAQLVESARGLRLVDISTMSAFEGCRSVYGRAKAEVENIFLQAGGSVLRPGLIWSDHPGGMMATLDRIARLPIAPVIAGGGKLYLIHVDDLAALIVAAVETPKAQENLAAVAHPAPFSLQEIVRMRSQPRRPMILPVPWPLVWLGVRAVEMVFPTAALRSDSVIGLVNADPAPYFDPAAASLRAFQG